MMVHSGHCRLHREVGLPHQPGACGALQAASTISCTATPLVFQRLPGYLGLVLEQETKTSHIERVRMR